MKALEINVDQYGQITESGIHDACIQEFHFIVGGDFVVRLRDPNGKDRCLTLRKISQIGFKDLVSGTIVSDIFCWKLSASTTSSAVMDEAWRVLLGGNYMEKDFQKITSTSLGKNAEKYLILFESSYGGSIAAICDDLSMHM